ncbi:MAG: helix-turn-helix domain-containing protein, partial [Planktomarina sp.]
MSVILPELEVLEADAHSIRYLEHGWPDPLCRWHSHKECELHLIVETKGKAFVGDYIGDFGPQSLFLTGPHQPHNWITDDTLTGPVETRDMMVQFDHEKIDGLKRHFPEFAVVTKLIERSHSGLQFFDFDFGWVRDKLASVRDARGPGQILVFLEIMTHLATSATVSELSVIKVQQSDGNTRHARIGEVIDHVIANYSSDLSVADAAELIAMTQPTFSRNFKAVTSHGFVDFVNRVRIGQACSLLYASDEPVTSICHQVGFKNVANFNRHFLKIKGVPPSQYRDTARMDLALAAIDTALWDLRCKKMALPLWKLAGGSRARIPLYSTEGGWLHLDAQALVDDAQRMQAQGFKGSKVKIGCDH